MPQPHRFAGMRVSEIVPCKKASIQQAPLEPGSPSWEEIEELTWEEIVERARTGEPGFRTIRKLLSDRRFDR